MIALLLSIAIAHASSTSADLAAIWSVEIRSAPAQALTKHCTSPDPIVRERAALTLGRLRDIASLPLLETLVRDSAIQVRATAAFSMGQTPESRTAILRALKDEDTDRVRTRLVAALGFQALDDDISLLLGLLEDSAPIRREAALGLARLALAGSENLDQPAVAAALSDSLGGFAPSSRRAVAFALAKIQPTELTDSTWDRLFQAVKNDRDPIVRAKLTRALAKSAGQRSQSLFEQAARDSEPSVRIAAARSIRDLELANPLLDLQDLLRDENWSVRLAATEELVNQESVPIALLRELTGEEIDPAIVATALTPLLLHADSDENPRPWLAEAQPIQIRQAAVGALNNKEQLLRIATEEAAPALRTAAATRLAELSPDDDALETLLGNSDPVVVGIALTHISENPEALDFVTVIESVGERAEAEIALELVSLLAKLPDIQTTSALQLISNYRLHPDLAVRTPAESLARELKLPPVPPVEFNTPALNLGEILRIRGARVITEAGEIRLSLRPDLAPLAVHQFATLAEQGFYNDVVFHRVVPDFVIQGGCPRGDGWGGPDRLLPAEPSWLPYTTGVVGMADAGHDTGGSQWFVTLSDQPHLEGRYTVFGSISLENGVTRRIKRGTRILNIQIERTADSAIPSTLSSGAP